MYELSSILANVRTQEAVAHAVARHIRQLFQATLLVVTFQQSQQSQRIMISEPRESGGKDLPDRVLPILNAWGLVGEIQIWRGEYGELPPAESRLLQDFVLQAARAFEHTQPIENGKAANGLTANTSTK